MLHASRSDFPPHTQQTFFHKLWSYHSLYFTPSSILHVCKRVVLFFSLTNKVSEVTQATKKCTFFIPRKELRKFLNRSPFGEQDSDPRIVISPSHINYFCYFTLLGCTRRLVRVDTIIYFENDRQ